MKYLKLLIAPLCILAFFALIGFAWSYFNLPPTEELVPVIKSFFETYGVALVFISAIIESAFIVGVYAPGGLIIFLGVIFSAGDPLRAVLVVLSVILGFLIGFTIDFYIGKFGWYKLFLHFGFGKILEQTKVRIQEYGLSVPWLAYHNPDTGSFVATAYGVLGLSYRSFFLKSILPIIAWCSFWGVLAYVLGMNALEIMGYKTLVVIMGVWIIARIVEMKLMERKNKQQLEEFNNSIPNLCFAETSSKPVVWTNENPTQGHCAIVAVLAQELFGGVIVKVSLKGTSYENLKSHFFNVINSREIDFTLSQFGGDIPYTNASRETVSKDEILSHPGTGERFGKLKNKWIKLV